MKDYINLSLVIVSMISLSVGCIERTTTLKESSSLNGSTQNPTCEPAGSPACGGSSGSFDYISSGNFTVHIPSTVAGSTGIAVKVYYPSTDHRRYSEGAPIAIFAPGGHSPSSLATMDTNYDKFGYVQVNFLMPGGSDLFDKSLTSGGTYDYRGPNCKRALADVIRYAQGKLRDIDGLLITDRLPFALVSNVGVVGVSNGGNLALTTLARHGSEFSELNWLATWESPIGDQAVVAELSEMNGQKKLNPYYVAGTSTVTSSPWSGLADALKFDSAATWLLEDPLTQKKSTAQGVLYLDSNGNGYYDTGDFRFTPLGGPNGKAYPSAELAAAITSAKNRLFPQGTAWPTWLATESEVNAYWSERDGSLVYGEVHTLFPQLLVMSLASVTDHVQSQPDHFHVMASVNGLREVGHSFIRLNPDSAYLSSVTGKAGAYPDNQANVNVAYPAISSMLVPDEADNQLLPAGIIELTDRAYFGNYAANLDGVLNGTTPATPVGQANGNKQYFIAIHNEPVDNVLLAKFYPMLKSMIAAADGYGVKLTLMFTGRWAEYISSDATRMSELAGWKQRGHEIAAHHHGVYHAAWDGYTHLSQTDALGLRSTGCGSTYTAPANYSCVTNAIANYNTYKGNLVDFLSLLKLLSPVIRSGGFSDDMDANEVPDEIIISTGNPYANFLPIETKLGDTSADKGRNEFVSVTSVQSIQRKYLSHTYMATSAQESSVETQFNNMSSGVYGVVIHSHDYQLDGKTAFDKLLAFLHQYDSTGSKSKTVSQVMDEALLPEKAVTLPCSMTHNRQPCKL